MQFIGCYWDIGDKILLPPSPSLPYNILGIWETADLVSFPHFLFISAYYIGSLLGVRSG